MDPREAGLMESCFAYICICPLEECRFSSSLTGKKDRKKKHLCLNVWTCINRGDILSWLTGKGPDSGGRNKIDSQPWHIYLHFLQQHQTSKFYWWQPRDLIISMILSDQMFNTRLVSCFFFFSWIYRWEKNLLWSHRSLILSYIWQWCAFKSADITPVCALHAQWL